MVRGSICGCLSPSSTHLSHTRDINPFELSVKGIFFIKKYVRSLIEVVIIFPLISACIWVCGYTTTGCSPEDLPEAMNDRTKWRERVRDISADGTT